MGFRSSNFWLKSHLSLYFIKLDCHLASLQITLKKKPFSKRNVERPNWATKLPIIKIFCIVVVYANFNNRTTKPSNKSIFSIFVKTCFNISFISSKRWLILTSLNQLRSNFFFWLIVRGCCFLSHIIHLQSQLISSSCSHFVWKLLGQSLWLQKHFWLPNCLEIK